MGTLARVLAEKQIQTPAENYWADVQGDIEDVDGVLKITRIGVEYRLKVPAGKEEDVQQALKTYLRTCPAAQSVLGCIEIVDKAVLEPLG